MVISRILAGVIIASLLVLPAVASEVSNNEDVSENPVVDVSQDSTDEPTSNEVVSTASIEDNQQVINNNLVFCAASIMSLGGLLCGFFTGKDLFTW